MPSFRPKNHRSAGVSPVSEETREVRVIQCEVYSRVCGYYRPTNGFNPGKKQEFTERVPVKIRSSFKDLQKK
jgi:anaerobic ribonucleoside-triphosphate reductase